MKNNQPAFMLVLVLLVCSLLAVWDTVRYIASARRIQMMQGQVLAVNNARGVLQALLNDTLEYSKKNPAILPILQPVAPKPAPAPAAAKPATK